MIYWKKRTCWFNYDKLIKSWYIEKIRVKQHDDCDKLKKSDILKKMDILIDLWHFEICSFQQSMCHQFPQAHCISTVAAPHLIDTA